MGKKGKGRRGVKKAVKSLIQAQSARCKYLERRKNRHLVVPLQCTKHAHWTYFFSFYHRSCKATSTFGRHIVCSITQSNPGSQGVSDVTQCYDAAFNPL